MTLATNEVHFAARLQRAGAPIDTVRLSSCRDREADEVREAGCLVISCHWNALLTSALLLQVRWDTPRFVVQILAQSRLSKA